MPAIEILSGIVGSGIILSLIPKTRPLGAFLVLVVAPFYLAIATMLQ